MDSLTTLIAAGPMEVPRALELGRDVARALTGVHGELHPGAIEVGSDGQVVAIQPPTGDRSRYAQYAAPERILGKPAIEASDIFSIGAILFHAMAGRPPFRGETARELMLSICADAPADLRALRPDVPNEVATLLYRCLMKEPEQRVPSLAALRDAVGPLMFRDSWPGKRLLIADDDAPVREYHSIVANRIGVTSDVVSSGREVIDALKARRYDVALLDLNMPRMDGWAVLDYLRAHRDQKPEHLFVVTGFGDQKISEADRDLVSAVLYKPVAPEALRSLVTECLRGGRVDLQAILRATPHRVVMAA